jgi:hypothetical protein
MQQFSFAGKLQTVHAEGVNFGLRIFEGDLDAELMNPSPQIKLAEIDRRARQRHAI